MFFVEIKTETFITIKFNTIQEQKQALENLCLEKYQKLVDTSLVCVIKFVWGTVGSLTPPPRIFPPSKPEKK